MILKYAPELPWGFMSKVRQSGSKAAASSETVTNSPDDTCSSWHTSPYLTVILPAPLSMSSMKAALPAASLSTRCSSNDSPEEEDEEEEDEDDDEEEEDSEDRSEDDCCLEPAPALSSVGGAPVGAMKVWPGESPGGTTHSTDMPFTSVLIVDPATAPGGTVTCTCSGVDPPADARLASSAVSARARL